MWNLIAALMLAVVSPGAATVTRLDGSSAAGKLASWTADSIVLQHDGAEQMIPAADVLTIQLSDTSSTDAGEPQIELTDGTTLPLATYTTSGVHAAVTTAPPAGTSSEPLTIPLVGVAAVRLQPLTADVLPQWQEIRSLEVPSDLVIVAKRGGKSLDHLECIVGKIGETEVELTVDGEAMKVPRSKVAGVVYFRTRPPADKSPPIVVSGVNGLRLLASQVTLEGEQLNLTSVGGVTIHWPLAGVANIDLSAGKLAFLSDLPPVKQDWQPLIALPTSATRAAKFGLPRFNQSADGGPLTLNYGDANSAPAVSQLKTFAKGIALRSESELDYRLPSGYRHLQAEVGIDPASTLHGNVQLSIYGDDRLLHEQTVAGAAAASPLDLDVAGVKRLKIVVGYGQNLDIGDWVHLCNARLVK